MNAGVLNINVRVERQDKLESNEILIYATIWTTFPNIRLKKFERKDLRNVTILNPVALGFLNLDLVLETQDVEVEQLKEPIPINCFLRLINGENADFEFNADRNNVFVTNVIDEITGRPTGTKRTVITYEDTDIIDDTRK